MKPRILPFASSPTMIEEPVLLIGTDAAADGRLLFEPQSIVSVTTGTDDVAFTEGRDFVVDRPSRRLTRPAGSRLPFVSREAIVASAGELTHARTVLVTYTHIPAGTMWQVRLAPGKLPRTSARLRDRQPLTIAITGDSISEGYDSSGFHRFAPFKPAYPTLVVDALTRECGVSVDLHNYATAGWTTADALGDLRRISALGADLFIVAFGMNDATYADADEFIANIGQLIDGIRAQQPKAEYLLVSPMLPTPECGWVVATRFEQYRSSLFALAGEGIRVADVTDVWHALSAHKDPHDLSGNGLNHPNDFGHRVYADVIATSLTDEAPTSD